MAGRLSVTRLIEQKLHRKQRRFPPEQHRGEHGDDLADVGAQQEADHLADVGVNAASFADCVDDGGKIVVGQCHIRRALGDVGAGDAHRAADVGGLQRGRVVHAVAGHGDHLTLPLPCLDDADLVFRRNAGVDGNVPDLALSSSSSVIASSSAPVIALVAVGCRMPSSRAIAEAVTTWSPVIITGLMPARRQVATAAFASGRGGSIIPTKPEEGQSGLQRLGRRVRRAASSISL